MRRQNLGKAALVDPQGDPALEAEEAHRAARRRRLVLAASVLPVVALLFLLTWSLVKSGGQPAGIVINSMFGDVAVKEGEARDFALPLFTGETLRVSDLRGKVVMVDFWSSWCPPCRAEAPVLAEAYRRYRDQGVEFVGVTIWDSEDRAVEFIEGHGAEYPNGLDSKGEIAIDYGVRGIPEKFFLDREGRLVRKYVGPVDEERLDAVLTELLLR